MSRSRGGAFAYLAVAAAHRGVAFLMLPMFARALPPAEYGQIAALLTIHGLALVLIPAGLELPLFRAMFAAESDCEKTDRLSTLVTALFVGSIAMGAILGCVSLLLPRLLGLDPFPLALSLFTAGIFTAGSIAPLTILRASERFAAYAFLSLGFAGVSAFLRGVLVVAGNKGVAGWVVADFAAAVAGLVLSLVWQREFLSTTRFRISDLRSALRVALPLVPHSASHWVLNVSDRLVVALAATVAVAGVYSMAAQIALVSALAVTELNRAFMPRYGEASVSEDASSNLGLFVRQQIISVAGISGCAAMLGPQVVRTMLPSSYQDSAELIPWLVLGSALLGLYYVPMNLLTIVRGQTSDVWYLSLIAGTVNIVLNLLFVPQFGVGAAAVNSVVGYFVLLSLVLRSAKRSHALAGLSLSRLTVPLCAVGVVGVLGSSIAIRSGTFGLATSVIGSGIVLLITMAAFGSQTRQAGSERAWFS